MITRKTMQILALDIAIHCGWAVTDTIFGVWDLTPKRDESSGMRLIRLEAKLGEIVESQRTELKFTLMVFI
jgi:hypothetical protein